MTAEQFRAAFDVIGWTHTALGRKLGMNEREVRRWYNGDYRVPTHIAEWMRRCADFHAANPPPERTGDPAK